MSLTLLAAPCGTELDLICEGKDADQAMTQLVDLFEIRFGARDPIRLTVGDDAESSSRYEELAYVTVDGDDSIYIARRGLLDSYAGLILPLIASATATFLLRQFYLTIPPELVEAARIDGAGPWRFLRDILLPLSKTNLAALFVIMFIYGWNQYLWPLLITTNADYLTVVVSLKRLLTTGDALVPWQDVTATAMLAMGPPVLVILLMQRYFVKGLVETEK